MAYCVNCGVELDGTLEKCPLCGTPVYRPNESTTKTEQSFPQRRGEVEHVSRRDTVIFISVLFAVISVTCGLLNVLVYDMFWWAIPVDGVCLTLWIFCMTALFTDKLTPYGMLLFDAAAIALYMYMLSWITPQNDWFVRVGVPILTVCLILLELFYLLSQKLPFSILAGILYFFISTAILCLTIEASIDLYLTATISLTWSAIVLTVCVIISVILLMTLMMGRLRNSVRRRFHF